MCGCNGGFGGGSGGDGPIKLSFTHTQFQAAALLKDIEAYSLPAKFVFRGAIIIPTIQFAGPGFVTYTMSLGLAGDFSRYVLPFDMLAAVSGTNNANGGPNLELLNSGAATSLRLQAVSTGANTNVSTAGAFDLYLFLSRLP